MGLNIDYVEGHTPLEEDEKSGLLVKSISTSEELDQLEQINIERAIVWLIHRALNQNYILSEEFIKRLHRRMFGDVWAWAGRFRKSNTNFGVEWTRIVIDLRNLLDDTNYWIVQHTYGNDEIAIRFKHKLVNIHCFPNGNGRHSRLMADLIIEKVLGGEVFSWKHSSTLKPDEIRKEYIQAIHQADQGNIQPLIKFARS